MEKDFFHSILVQFKAIIKGESGCLVVDFLIVFARRPSTNVLISAEGWTLKYIELHFSGVDMFSTLQHAWFLLLKITSQLH